ncbi:MAG: aminotransferase class I/II-fold pyridoxal phosphate-dependent enzyme [Synechococcus sp. SB0668_bin_15]|nr:aminotransferase class I/II-fold pyridoxal phosphate-dependent enzyme [Synechococcus sp. SB0668_bin_15]MXZ82247.1 aminotransferase class I/II-fold pyridoxal phosphate-dependent enzyme [Synechococcus sp. SB0666_bin_14]MYA91746.1 aminotransferase class I/II-fold pyridoxal phosphate-dependent enzyme [Synechococcus sp. SB0663_bin_10]MYC49586.1 aminotransferase class I/II-fold pyridoxal phosphate-dependent enzyme [Synechococcus sp. SB0662_bin_14]MYG45957.1 aminotransferase class I/II-fold pyridox
MDRAKAAARRHHGQRLIDLSLGCTDQPPPLQVTAAIARTLEQRSSAAYCLHAATRPLRVRVAAWIQRRFAVAVDPDTQVLLLVGSQEGTAHFPLAVLEPGEHGLILDPGYPSHLGGLQLASARIQRLALDPEDGWRPPFASLSHGERESLRLMVFGFPHNPTATVGEQDWLDEAMAMARRHDILVAHDNPYVDLALDGEAPCLLRSPGWQERGIEFFSFSKSWCMGGFRIAFAVGATPLIQALQQVKGWIDFNQSLAVQAGAMVALDQLEDWPARLRSLYRRRRDHMVQALATAGWPVTPRPMALYLWDRLPRAAGAMDSLSFCLKLVQDTGVALTPGSGFGAAGRRHVRMALVAEEPHLTEAAQRVGAWLKTL